MWDFAPWVLGFCAWHTIFSHVLPLGGHNTLYIVHLRVRAFLHRTFQVYQVCCNFILGYIFQIAVNFGALKDESLLINIFASNNRFSDGNIFQNGVDALSKIDDAFLTKS